MQRDAPQVFNGTGNLLSFLDRISVWTTLKGFESEKKALALASRLEGAAFENYQRLYFLRHICTRRQRNCTGSPILSL